MTTATDRLKRRAQDLGDDEVIRRICEFLFKEQFGIGLRCSIEADPAVAVWDFETNALYLLPVELWVDPDAMPPQVLCRACAERWAGVPLCGLDGTAS